VSYRRALIRLLDRPGGRRILGSVATRAMLKGNPNYEIKYVKGSWTRRLGSQYLLDGPKFQYNYEDSSHWIDQLNQYVATAKEFWLRYYQPKEGDIIVDVGAGRGEDTLMFSRAVGETGRVIAIEAHPLSFAILQNFCHLNRLTNVTTAHIAVMDKPRQVRINEDESPWTWNAVAYGDGGSGIEARATTIDDVCKEYGIENISFLKMNIEGTERYALLGMQSVISRTQQICVACHDFRAEMGHGDQFRTRAFVEGFLTEHGFTVASRDNDPRDYVRDHVFGLRGSSR